MTARQGPGSAFETGRFIYKMALQPYWCRMGPYVSFEQSDVAVGGTWRIDGVSPQLERKPGLGAAHGTPSRYLRSEAYLTPVDARS